MLGEALQRNAKPRKRGDFRNPKDGIYAAKPEARLSMVSKVSNFRTDPPTRLRTRKADRAVVALELAIDLQL